MGIVSLVRLFGKVVRSSDLVAFLVSAFVANLVASLLLDTWYNYAYIFLSYHLFLIWLVIDAKHEKKITLPIGLTITTHAVCFILIIPTGLGDGVILYFEYLRFCIPTLAYIELKWLINLGVKKQQEPPVNVPMSNVVAAATAEDHEAWLHYLTHRDPRLLKPGMSIKEEYEQWLADRARKRGATS